MGHKSVVFNTKPRKPESVIPRWLRKKLTKHQIQGLGIAHISNLDEISRGQADEQTLWDWVHSVSTWSLVAAYLKVGIPEMAEQSSLSHHLIDRYEQTGHVVLIGDEYQLARKGVCVMDQLAELVDQHTADVANQKALVTTHETANACHQRMTHATVQHARKSSAA